MTTATHLVLVLILLLFLFLRPHKRQDDRDERHGVQSAEAHHQHHDLEEGLEDVGVGEAEHQDAQQGGEASVEDGA